MKYDALYWTHFLSSLQVPSHCYIMYSIDVQVTILPIAPDVT